LHGSIEIGLGKEYWFPFLSHNPETECGTTNLLKYFRDKSHNNSNIKEVKVIVLGVGPFIVGYRDDHFCIAFCKAFLIGRNKRSRGVIKGGVFCFCMWSVYVSTSRKIV
jgi:hypothetical protein